MLDIRLIREKPDFVRERLATRGGGDELKIDEVLRVDAERRKAETRLQQLNAARNKLSKDVGIQKRFGGPIDETEEQVRQLNREIRELEARVSSGESEQRDVLLNFPNL